VRQIGNDLRVSHVLEGSVRKSGDRLHMNTQLIDTRTDTHVWAEQYDRDVNALFTIQSEIAQKVAEQLHAKISAAEKVAIERKPTTDLVANALYVEAMEFYSKEGGRRNLLEPVRLLEEAVARDPHFVLAYCMLGQLHLEIFLWDDHTPAAVSWPMQPSRMLSASNPTLEKFTARWLRMPIGAFSITTALGPNSNSLVAGSQTMPRYTTSPG
jgi:hypothetical protein